MSARIKCPHCSGEIELERNFLRRVVELEREAVRRELGANDAGASIADTGPGAPPIPGVVVKEDGEETLLVVSG